MASTCCSAIYDPLINLWFMCVHAVFALVASSYNGCDVHQMPCMHKVTGYRLFAVHGMAWHAAVWPHCPACNQGARPCVIRSRVLPGCSKQLNPSNLLEQTSIIKLVPRLLIVLVPCMLVWAAGAGAAH